MPTLGKPDFTGWFLVGNKGILSVQGVYGNFLPLFPTKNQ